MKKWISLFSFLSLLPVCALSNDESAPAAKGVPHDTHSGYFVSNKFEPEAKASFVVIQDQETFSKVFGAAVVQNDKSHRLPADAFARHLVVAAIHRGKAMVTYKIASVVAEGKALIVTYTTESEPSESAEFSCPLILSVEKGGYTSVRFVEDGREVKTIQIVGA